MTAEKKSAGILLYRTSRGVLEVFLVHPGGPFWAKKDFGAWSIPKGEFSEEEDPLTVAKREFEEETGSSVKGDFRELTPLDQPSRKTVYAWAVEGACDERNIKSNTFTIEWPPKSGRQRKFPEIDRAGWFTISRAKEKMLKGQVAFLGQLLSLLGQKASPDRTDGDEGITDEHGQQSLF